MISTLSMAAFGPVVRVDVDGRLTGCFPFLFIAFSRLALDVKKISHRLLELSHLAI